MLRNISLKGVYKSDFDNILKDFYFPALSVANQYDRAVGFFSASTISHAAQALSVFVKHGGRIRLILGAFTDPDDVEAVNEGYSLRKISRKVGDALLSEISNVHDELFQNRFETIAWLVAHGSLDVKIALRPHGMFHDKVGIITDADSDKVVFSGSANESVHALLPAYNYESINVFRSWNPDLREYYEPHIDSFDRLWNNTSNGTAVMDIPDAVKDNLISVARNLEYTPDPSIEAAIAAKVFGRIKDQSGPTRRGPRSPVTLNGKPFKLREHQAKALAAWKAKGDFHGVFDLATGAGKTITAIHAVVKLSESIDRLICVIAVPYQNLADQWVESLSAFGIHPLRCYVSQDLWKDELKRVLHELSMGARRFAAIVVVNRTLKSGLFQELMATMNGNRMFWIGDECHHHTTSAFAGFLPNHARFRIGLSATPEHYLDIERNERLNEFYGDIVFQYSLLDAIRDGVLTPYLYYPQLIELTDDEAVQYVEISDEIGRMAMMRRDSKASTITPPLAKLLSRRARLMGSAVNKLSTLKGLIAGKMPSQHTLFYCGDGTVETDEHADDMKWGLGETQRQVEAISAMLHGMGWNVSRFTARESRGERLSTMENFRLGIIDAMVAIRCLDEGIDVPACSTAYILASSRDPRQFVQRRGRILRQSAGKDIAIIHDMVVVLPEGYETDSDYAKRLLKSELRRVAEFSSQSENRSEAYSVLAPLLRTYDLEHMV